MKRNGTYELHITMEGEKNNIRENVEKLKWKFYSINGDPELGEGEKYCALLQRNSKNSRVDMINQMNLAAERLRSKDGIKVVKMQLKTVTFSSVQTFNGRVSDLEAKTFPSA